MRVPLRVASVTLDLDGTLLDTVPDLADAVAAMLADLSLPQRSEEEVRRYVGRGIQHLVQRCLGNEQAADAPLLERAQQCFRRHYARTNGRKARPYPGVLPALESLRSLRVPMAVVTNKSAAFTEPLLAGSGLDGYFAFAVSGDSLAEKKPHPLPLLHACGLLGSVPAANLHIGDSRHDAACARAAGCPVVLVDYGYNEGEDVRKLDCDAIVGSLEAAVALIAAA